MPTEAPLSSRPTPAFRGSCEGRKIAALGISSMCAAVCNPAAATIRFSWSSDTTIDPTTTALMSQFQMIVGDITAGRTRLASKPVGHDADAALKTRLTDVTLDPAILTV